MKRIGIIFLLLVAGGFGLVAFLRGPGLEFAENLLSDAQEAASPTSFSSDQDRDGLSDAKENIYGTRVDVPDTDRDGFLDGEEVKDGFDPTLPGEARIEENERLMANLTVRYFLWAREVAGVEDPQLSDEAAQQFLEVEGLAQGDIPSIPDRDLQRGEDDSDEAVLAYVDRLAEIQLPQATASFLDLADEVVREQQSDILDDVISGLDETYEEMSAITVPPKLADLHREQLALLKALRNLFLDLYAIESDPVLLIRDINWGDDLLLQSVDLEHRRLEITRPVLEAAGRIAPRSPQNEGASGAASTDNSLAPPNVQ